MIIFIKNQYLYLKTWTFKKVGFFFSDYSFLFKILLLEYYYADV